MEKNNFLISLAGDSGAGKTSLLGFMSQLWKDDLLLIEGDAYHKWERGDEHWKETTPLNPRANNLDKCVKDLTDLKNNKLIQFREYNHSTGHFDPEKTLFPKKKIVFAGLHSLFSQELREIADLKIFLNTDEDLRLFWKYKRDIQERGYTKDDVAKSLEKRIKDSKKYIRPQVYYADIIVNIIDENLEFDNLDYVPQVSMNLLIDKKLIYIKEVLHILKNINFRIYEDEKFIRAYYDERFEHVQSIHI